MKRAAVALSALIASTSRNVGLEGAFLLAGTACLAVFAATLNPAGPWLVVGVVTLLLGLALAIPRSR